MSRQTRVCAWALIAAVLIPLVSLSAATPEGPTLTESLVDRLLNLPYGLSGQRGLVVRYKHVDSVQFYGAGTDSKFSFIRGNAVIPGGLSLRLKNTGPFSWASGTIRLKNPMNVTKYNSVVVWVRTTHPGLRFWVGVQDPRWKESDRAQARTDVLPFRGFPTNQPVQLVIPFAAIYPDQPVDYTHLSQLAFEFGQDTVGNVDKGEIEILGIAFVHQQRPIRRVRIVTERALVRAERPIVKPGAIQPATPSTETVPEPLAKNEPMNRAAQTAQTLLKMTEAETTNFFKSMGFEMKRPEPVEEAKAPAAPLPIKRVEKPLEASAAPIAVSTAETLGAAANALRWPAMAAGTTGFGVFAGALWVLTRRRNGLRLSQLPKIFHAIHWPFTITESTSLARFQKDFWKGLAAERVKVGWLSVTGNIVDKTSDEEFYGARFLERQVRLAGEAGVRLFPSLSFTKTVFHYESFLANPKVYHVKPVDEADRELADADLRVKEKNGFPVWVPSYWQNKYSLPYRVIVDIGRGAAKLEKGLVQFNVASPELRGMAIRTIERFAESAPGVRIEDAASLLSTRLPKPKAKKEKISKAAVATTMVTDAASPPIPVNGAGTPVNGTGAPVNGTGTANNAEFWADVISTIKVKHPDFLFVASAAGEDAEALRAFGFDYVENDRVVETLVEHVRAGVTSPVEKALNEHAQVLKDSIYDVTDLIRPTAATEVAQRQNLLSTILLSLLPGVLQHDDNLPDDVTEFIQRISRSTVLRKGHFVTLQTNSANVLAFARWRRRALFLAVANFSTVAQEAAVRIDPIIEGIDDNKLYLFNNAVHGTELLRNIINTGNGGPAMALWGQNLRDAGVMVRLPGLSLKLFSVNLTRPIPTAPASEEVLTTVAAR